jgi:hypothetical protein
MNISILETGLFPDTETMEEAITHLEPIHNVYRYRISDHEHSDAEWDQMLDEIIASDRVFTL